MVLAELAEIQRPARGSAKRALVEDRDQDRCEQCCRRNPEIAEYDVSSGEVASESGFERLERRLENVIEIRRSERTVANSRGEPELVELADTTVEQAKHHET